MNEKNWRYMILKRINENTGIVNLKLITPKGPKPPRPKQPTLRELILVLTGDVKSIKERLENLDSRVAKLENKVESLIKLNNLRTE